MDEVAGKLIVYGPLGIITLLMIIVTIQLYRDREADRKAHTAQLAAERAEHTAQMKVMEDKYVTKAESWMQKYHDLADAQNKVLDSLTRRSERERRDSGTQR